MTTFAHATAPTWQEVFAVLARRLPRAGLEALAEALAADDQALVQGHTTWPWPEDAAPAAEPGGFCPLAYALAKGLGLKRQCEVEDAFFRLAEEARAAGALSADFCRVTRAWGGLPREEARAAWLPEVRAALAGEGEPC